MWLKAKGTARWSLKVKLPRGTYTLLLRARDRAGNLTAKPARRQAARALTPGRDACLAAPIGKDGRMGFDQYHEPPEELPAETRTFARLCASLTEEAEAIGWYEQRIAVEPDREARAIMRDAQGEEFKHFCMDLEYLLRRTPLWREIAEGILFQDGDIVEHGEEAEEEAVEGAAERGRAARREHVARHREPEGRRMSHLLR